MRTPLPIVLLLAIVPVLFILGYRWDISCNHGYEFGYYGDFNRIKHSLMKTPGVKIVGDFANVDMTLEEFGFDIVTSIGQKIHLHIDENDPMRDLAGEPLHHALMDKMQKQAASSNLAK